jgi:hypothetical protein
MAQKSVDRGMKSSPNPRCTWVDNGHQSTCSTDQTPIKFALNFSCAGRFDAYPDPTQFITEIWNLSE